MLQHVGPKPLIEPEKLKSKADWIEAGRRVFDEADHIHRKHCGTMSKPVEIWYAVQHWIPRQNAWREGYCDPVKRYVRWHPAEPPQRYSTFEEAYEVSKQYPAGLETRIVRHTVEVVEEQQP